jgi:hypothetical protein
VDFFSTRSLMLSIPEATVAPAEVIRRLISEFADHEKGQNESRQPKLTSRVTASAHRQPASATCQARTSSPTEVFSSRAPVQSRALLDASLE